MPRSRWYALLLAVASPATCSPSATTRSSATRTWDSVGDPSNLRGRRDASSRVTTCDAKDNSR